MVTEETNKDVIKQLKDKIKDGIYSIGEKVVPQVFKKLSLVNDEIKVEEITIQGKIYECKFVYWICKLSDEIFPDKVFNTFLGKAINNDVMTYSKTCSFSKI